MPRKKINFNTSTKLKGLSELRDIEKNSSLEIMTIDSVSRPTSFRLRTVDTDRIEETLRKINSLNQSHPFNKTLLIRGLIMLSTESDPKKLLNYIRKSL